MNQQQSQDEQPNPYGSTLNTGQRSNAPPPPPNMDVEAAGIRDQAAGNISAAQRELADIRAQTDARVAEATESLQREEQAATIADQRRRTELEATKVQRASDLAGLERQMNAQLADYEDQIKRGDITVQNPNAPLWSQGQQGRGTPPPVPFPTRHAAGGIIPVPPPPRPPRPAGMNITNYMRNADTTPEQNAQMGRARFMLQEAGLPERYAGMVVQSALDPATGLMRPLTDLAALGFAVPEAPRVR